MVDRYEELDLACNAADSYPNNLIRSQAFRYSLRSYHANLQEQHARIFDPNTNYTVIHLWEAFDKQNGFSPTSCRSFQALKSHLKANPKDPLCRHVFIQAPNSRACLDCSKEMFTYVSSFLQISARFLDFVFAFGKQRLPTDFHYTAFRQENFLGVEEARKFAIPRLGRSGREIRHCYNLWSVERTESGREPWSIRQTAVYHAFDVDNGGALWVNLKGNDVIQKRIKEATTQSSVLRAASLTNTSRSFAATLMTHFILFEWCAENWRAYISKLEKDMESVLEKVHNAPLEDVERALSVDTRALMQPLECDPVLTSTPPSRANTAPRRFSVSRQSSAAAGTFSRQRSRTSTFTTSNNTRSFNQSLFSALSKFFTESKVKKQKQQLPITQPMQPVSSSQRQSGEQGDASNDCFEILDQFSFDQLQRLHGVGSHLREASLVIKLNTDILTSVFPYYETLLGSAEFPNTVKNECKSDISEFFQRVKSIIRELEMERSRIETLMRVLEDGKSLFYGILQFRNVEINKMFAMNAHRNSANMEAMTSDMHESTIKMEEMTASMQKIAAKTERDTASMHIITWVTLVFLPGTFLATFFGSGLFQWNQNDPEEMPVWKPKFFILFAEICFPSMGLIFLVWTIAYFRARWKDKSDDEEQARMSESDEKFQKP